MPSPETVAHRVFPWDADAAPGEAFSASFVPASTGAGRFDLPGSPVLYLAETPEHGVAEKIARFRGSPLADHHLSEYGRRLAQVEVTLGATLIERLADLCDPAVLLRHGLRPDALASRDRETTQRIARDLATAGRLGLRWWSSFHGDWHGLVLFGPEAMREVVWGEPVSLHAGSAEVVAAARELGMRVAADA